MLNKILAAAAIPSKEARFPNPPAQTYAVFFVDVTATGPDGYNRIFTHDISVELYEPQRDDAAEEALEAELNKRGIPWTKQARYWLDTIRRYQVIYEFSYIVKT